MDNSYFFVRQLDFGIHRLNLRIVPKFDFTEINFADRIRVEMHLAGLDASDVYYGNNSAHYGRKLQQVALLQSFRCQRCIGSAELNGSLGDLSDSSAGTDRLIIELNSGGFAVIECPCGVNGIRERCPGAVKCVCSLDRNCSQY